MHKLWFWLLPALAWVGCKSSEKAAYTPQTIVPTENALLWKISGNGLKKPSYLYGTIHMIPKSEFKLSDATRSALENAKRVTFEIDMKDMTNFRTQLGLMTKAFMAGGKTLKDLLPPEDYAFVRAKMEEKGLPAGMFERMKPMFLSTMFSSDDSGTGGNPMTGDGDMTSVEMELYKTAKKNKTETAGLETASYQMAIFDSIPYTVQAKMLVDGLRSTVKSGDGDELDEMLKMYRDQDITGMQAMISGDKTGMSDYEDVLLNNRNHNWISVMGRFMKDKSTFFAVGAGHLGGPSGVVALLRKNGYRVDAVGASLPQP